MITPPHNDRERLQLERLKNRFWVLWGVWFIGMSFAALFIGRSAFIPGIAFGLLAAVVQSVWEMRIVHGPGWWRS